MTTSAADTPSPRWISVGIPRPSSRTLQEPSGLSVTTTSFAKPASASSIALSTTSYTMWWRPEPSSVSPIYMPGRLRTASRPFRTWMDSAPYSFLDGVVLGAPDLAAADLVAAVLAAAAFAAVVLDAPDLRTGLAISGGLE